MLLRTEEENRNWRLKKWLVFAERLHCGAQTLVLADGFSGWLAVQSPVPNLMAWKWAGKGRMALMNLQKLKPFTPKGPWTR